MYNIVTAIVNALWREWAVVCFDWRHASLRLGLMLSGGHSKGSHMYLHLVTHCLNSCTFLWKPARHLSVWTRWNCISMRIKLVYKILSLPHSIQTCFHPCTLCTLIRPCIHGFLLLFKTGYQHTCLKHVLFAWNKSCSKRIGQKSMPDNWLAAIRHCDQSATGLINNRHMPWITD